MEHIMADYFQSTVIQQSIPDADMTPLEHLLLQRIFSSERDGAGWYFFAEDNPAAMITINRTEIEKALEASPDESCAAYRSVVDQIESAGPDCVEIDLDLSDMSWEFFLQDIVKRSKTLTYISIVTSFTCSRMRPDGFGGMAVLVTRDAIIGKTTGDFLADMIAEAGLQDEDPAKEAVASSAAATEE
jgi:hypothetical protein